MVNLLNDRKSAMVGTWEMHMQMRLTVLNLFIRIVRIIFILTFFWYKILF